MKRKNKIFQADLAAFKLLGYVLVFIWGMLCFLPFLLVVMNSFTSEANIMRNGYSFWPGEWTLEAYKTCLENPERIGFAYRNTIIATIVGTVPFRADVYYDRLRSGTEKTFRGETASPSSSTSRLCSTVVWFRGI